MNFKYKLSVINHENKVFFTDFENYEAVMLTAKWLQRQASTLKVIVVCVDGPEHLRGKQQEVK